MYQVLTSSMIFLSALPVATAAAQPFAEAETGVSEEALGPQGLPGRRTRTQETVPTPTERTEPTSEEPVAEPPRAWFGQRDWHEWDRATGDWAGVRTSFEDGGLTLEGSYTADWLGVVSGGVDESWSVRGLLDINATLDLAKAFG